MNKEIEAQVEFEEHDVFKQNIVYPLLSQKVNSHPNQNKLKLLTIGEGSGQISKYLDSDRINYAVLVDINHNILNVASKNFQFAGFSEQSCNADAQMCLPIKPESIDIAIASFSLNQIEDIYTTLSNIKRCLIKDGKMLLVVPNEKFILFCSTFRPDRLSSKVEDFNKGGKINFNFTSVDLKAELFIRSNSEYVRLMERSGFGDIQFSDLYDPNDESLGPVPKGFFISATKI